MVFRVICHQVGAEVAHVFSSKNEWGKDKMGKSYFLLFFYVYNTFSCRRSISCPQDSAAKKKVVVGEGGGGISDLSIGYFCRLANLIGAARL